MKKKLTHALGLKFILSAFICILPQRLPNLRPQQTGGSSPQPEGKSFQNLDLEEIWEYFGSDLAGLQLFYHCIDSGFQHRFSHLLVESYRFRMVLCEFRW